MSLNIFLLGQFNLQANDQSLNLPSRPAQSLMAYLVLNPGVEHRREKLAALFWPETTDSNARSYLRQALWRVRKTFSESPLSCQDYIQVQDLSIKFEKNSNYWLDADQLTSVSEDQSIESIIEIVSLYKGELLPGFYEDWVVLERDRFNAAYQQKMNLLLDCLVEKRQWDDVLAWSEDWILHGFSNEPAYRALMLGHAAKGDQSQVVATYQRCSEALQREIGVSPSRETQQLFNQLRDNGITSSVSSTAPTFPPDELPPFLVDDRPEIDKGLFVSRKYELNRLQDLLTDAKSGRGSVVFITGEAGSGKSSLIQEITHRTISEHPNFSIAIGNCNAQSGLGDPYLPFREILELLTGDVEARWQAGAISNEHARMLWNNLPLSVQALLEVGPDLIDTFISGSAILNRARTGLIQDNETLKRLDQLVNQKSAGADNPNPLQQSLFNQYNKVLQFLSQEKPIVIIIDDLQWADLGSISLLFHLGRQIVGCNILIIGAYRSEEVALVIDGERHPLLPVINEIQRIYSDIFINLDKTDSHDFIELVIDSEPNLLQPSFKEMLYKQTHGHPLFTIELMRGLQERGDLIQDQVGNWIEGPNLAWDAMPGRIEAVIAERIGRLSEAMQQTLRVASVEGETFTAEILAQVQEMDEREMLSCLSGDLERKHRLVKAQSIQRVGGQLLSAYKFKHILFQKYLYNSLDEIERVHLHERVGNAVERFYGADQEITNIAPALARHFHEARMIDKEIEYLRQAGERALLMSAYQEAISHLTSGLDLLMTQSETKERSERELAFQLVLGQAWVGPQGYGPEVKSTYTRARHLCEQLNKKQKLCQVLGQLAVQHFVHAEYQLARDLGEEALQLAEQIDDPILIALSHWHLGFIWFSLGEFRTSREHSKQVIRFYKAGQYHRPLVALRGSDSGTSAMAYDALCLWCLGYKDQAKKIGEEVIDLASKYNHPFSLADALCYAGCWLNAMEHDSENLLIYAEQLKDLSSDNKLAGWTGSGIYFLGEALAKQGQIEEGISLISEGITNEISINVRCTMVGALRSLAESQLQAGGYDDGLLTIHEALEFNRQTGERIWEAELYRIRAQLQRMIGEEQYAEASLRKSIQIAQQQEAKSWELRSTIDLARLWCEQGKQADAHHALTEIYKWFTEGFESSDLIEAKELLQELS